MPFFTRSLEDLPIESIHGLTIRSLFRPEEADRLSLRWIEVPPGRTIPPSLHRVAREVLYILEGEAEFTVGDETRVVGAGRFLNVPPGTPHSMRTLASAIRFLAIQSPPVENDKDFEWVAARGDDPSKGAGP